MHCFSWDMSSWEQIMCKTPLCTVASMVACWITSFFVVIVFLTPIKTVFACGEKLVYRRSIPEEMNTSESWAVNTQSATCQLWLMSWASPHCLSLFFPFHKSRTVALAHAKRLCTLAHTWTRPPPTHRQLGRHSPGPVPSEEHGGRWTGRSCRWGHRDTESASHFR